MLYKTKSADDVIVVTVRSPLERRNSRRGETTRIAGKTRDRAQKEPENTDYETHYNMGVTYWKMDLFDEALEQFTIASKDPGRTISCILKISHCYGQKQEYPKALAELEKGLALEGRTVCEHMDIRLQIMKVCELSGDRERAARERARIDELNAGQTLSRKPNPCGATELDAASAIGLPTRLFSLLTAAVLFLGWHASDQEYLVAESGLGYALGIAGSLVMLSLLLYPVRKKVRGLQSWGATKIWFQAHMILGILGPVLVLFHANFRIGSLNSSVVLISTLVVAASGIVGLIIYTKIHYGLYGKRACLKELQEEIKVKRSSLSTVFGYAPKLKQRLLGFEAAVLTPCHGVLHSLARLLSLGLRTHWNYVVLVLGLRRALKVTARRAGWTVPEQREQRRAARRHISAHLHTVLKIAEFSVYERMFALWHLLHFPLFFFLMAAGLVHVLAVHMY